MQRVKQLRPTGCGLACIAMLEQMTFEKVQQRAVRLRLSIGSEAGRGFRTFPFHCLSSSRRTVFVSVIRSSFLAASVITVFLLRNSSVT